MNTRAWLAVALASVSWTAGLGYYRPADMWLWAACVVAAVLLWTSGGLRLPAPFARGGEQQLSSPFGRGDGGEGGQRGTVPFSLRENRDSPQRENWDSRQRFDVLAAVILIPVVAWMPWPYRAAPLLLSAGLALPRLPRARRWGAPLAGAMRATGLILLAQSAAILLYLHHTARSHDLPAALAELVGVAARAAGIDASVEGPTLALRAGGCVERLGATWDLFLDPATLLFLIGGLVALALVAIDHKPQHAPSAWFRPASALVLMVAAWLPVRWALFLGLYIQRVLRADPTLPLGVMNQALSWWLPAVLLAGPALAAAWLLKPPCDAAPAEAPPPAAPRTKELSGMAPARRRVALGAVSVALGAAALAGVCVWQPVGTPQGGRVKVVERHSRWEPTTADYDEDSYGESASYTYRLLYDYAARFFAMSRLTDSEAIDAESLADCDVLVVKTPTERFAPQELDAIERFVRRGGGLLLIGDHTNVFNSTAYLNDLARRFGFALRDDLLFYVGNPYEQPHRPARVPHPAVQHVQKMDYAVSCSVDPGRSDGRAALVATGLWSLPAQYEHENYHPPAEYRSTMRTGPFVQLWAAPAERGRVLAFTDSTIFSNFSLFQPGKAELALGMLDWLNRRSPLDDAPTWRMVMIPLGLAGAAILAFGLWTARRDRPAALLVASALLGMTAAAAGATAWARAAMPPLAPQRDAIDVVIDRTLSDVPLSKGAYIQGDGLGFGLLEQWIPRIGCFTSRRSGTDVFAGDALVVIEPSGPVDETYRQRLVEYVAQGGRLLVLDSPDNDRSTANSLLWSFGLSVGLAAPVRGEVVLADRPERLADTLAWPVSGGTPLARIGDAPVVAQARLGRGRVTVIGFSTAFDDARMGYSWQPQPDAALRARYKILYAFLHAALDPQPQ